MAGGGWGGGGRGGGGGPNKKGGGGLGGECGVGVRDQIRKGWGVRQKLQKLISGDGGLLFETGE